MFEIDLATDAVTVNEPGREIYGWETPTITFAQVQTHFHPDDRDAVMKAVTAALAPGGPGTFEVEQRIFRVDGEERWIRVRGLALFAGSGDAKQPVRLVGTYLDITDRKRTEEALLRQAAELRAQDQRKDQFIAMLAHELRNPLVPIRNAVHLLSLTREQETVNRVQEMVNRQVEHLSHIVDDLLDVSRVSTGKVELRRGLVDLAQVVSNVVSDLRRAFDTAGVRLELVVPEIPAWVDGDRTRLTQIVDNLVSNALKFTDRGGEVSVSVRTDGTRAVLAVRDTGIGIEPELLSRLFEPFTQADRSLDRTRGGLGLGLALVKGLTEPQGGSVRVASEGAGLGSLFTVILPSSLEPPPLRDRPMDRTPASARRMRVLVVEDNVDAAESLRMLLKHFGCEVRVAHTGPDGVRTAMEMEPDLVVCDIGLPGLDGYGVAKSLRQTFNAGKPVLVALTGYGDEDDKLRAAEAGFDRHYTKPVDPAVLRALLSSGA
jgi:PAS domain S-box-containing protein